MRAVNYRPGIFDIRQSDAKERIGMDIEVTHAALKPKRQGGLVCELQAMRSGSAAAFIEDWRI